MVRTREKHLAQVQNNVQYEFQLYTGSSFSVLWNRRDVKKWANEWKNKYFRAKGFLGAKKERERGRREGRNEPKRDDQTNLIL